MPYTLNIENVINSIDESLTVKTTHEACGVAPEFLEVLEGLDLEEICEKSDTKPQIFKKILLKAMEVSTTDQEFLQVVISGIGYWGFMEGKRNAIAENPVAQIIKGILGDDD